MSTPPDVTRQNYRIDSNLELEGTLIPSDTNSFDLGNEDRRFRNIYLADPHDGVSAIHFGDYVLTAQDIVSVKLMADTNLTLRKGGVDFYSDIPNKPTTLTGYGITDAATFDQGTRADTAHASVTTTSAAWNSTHTSVFTTSSNWDDTYTRVGTYGNNWDSTHTSVLASSSNWDSTHTSVHDTSANWDSTYTSVHDTSATWNYAYDNSISSTATFTNIKVPGEVDADSVKVEKDIVLNGKILGPSTMYVDPLAHGDNTGKLVILGDLHVDGVTTTVNSTTITVSGKTLNLAQGSADASAADNSGLHIQGADATLKYRVADDRWHMNKQFKISSTHPGIIFDKTDNNRGSVLAHDASGLYFKVINNNDTTRFLDSDNITNMLINHNTQKVGINTATPSVTLHVSGSDAIKIPAGTTAERPVAIDSAQQGYIRYNTTTDQFEGFGSNETWGVIGGVKDRDLDTYISTESEPGEDEDYIKFYTEGTERLEITKTGDVGVDTNSNVQDKLHVAKGALRVSKDFGANTRYNMLNLASNRSIDDYGGLNSTYWSIDLQTPFNDHRRGNLIFSTKNKVDDSTLHDAITLTHTGNIGVGTTSPSTSLHVSGGALNNQAIFESTDGTSSVQFKDPFGIAEFGNKGDNAAIMPAGVEKMRITSDGNVGIGTTNPSRVLTINHDHPGIRFEDADGDPAHVTQVSSYNGTMYFDCDMANPDNTAGRTSGKGFVFRTDANTTETPSGDELLVVRQDGNVGIGTDSPTHNLHLSGDAQVKLKIESTGGNPEIQFTQPDAEDNSKLSHWMIGQSVVSNSLFITKHETGGGYQLVIDNEGNVGIGTSSPSEKLHVNGAVKASSMTCPVLLGEPRSSNTTVIDTTITPDMFRVLEVFGESNPNTGGSVDYVDPIHMMVYHGTGYATGAKIESVYATQIGPMARSQFTTGGPNNGNDVDVVWVDKTVSPEAETAQCPFGSTTHTLRFKLADPHPVADPSWSISITRRL